MSPDTAEIVIVDAANAGQLPLESASVLAGRASDRPPGRRRHESTARAGGLGSWTEWLARRRADPVRMAAVRDTWRALWLSRLLVWIAGAGTVATLGFGPLRGAFNPPGITRGFGWLGNLLAAPAARWDSVWYLVIAHYGYRPDLGSYTAPRDAFFPLYPLGLRGLSDLGLEPVLAGVLFSLAAFAAALYGIHRLSTLELGGDSGAIGAGAGVGAGRPDEDTDRSAARSGEVARLAVLVTALAPMAFYFSAVYSESLYLALSVGLFWCARQGRWAWVGVLGALAAATRSTGIVLMAPALMLYLYGPREDLGGGREGLELERTSERLAPGESVGTASASGWVSRASAGQWPAARGRTLVGRLRPRYRLRANVLWLALVPGGLLLYMLYLGLHGGDTLAAFHSQNVWGRHFAGPYLGIWDGVRAAFEGARQLLSGQSAHLYFPIASGSPTIAASHNLMLLAFLLAAVPLLVLALRLLPPAYGAYTILALALPLSYPVAAQPLMSLPRFLVVLFPLSIALAAWLAAHPRIRVPALVVSAALQMFFVAQFATWHWVA